MKWDIAWGCTILITVLLKRLAVYPIANLQRFLLAVKSLLMGQMEIYVETTFKTRQLTP
jgi:hypothetical protein